MVLQVQKFVDIVDLEDMINKRKWIFKWRFNNGCIVTWDKAKVRHMLYKLKLVCLSLSPLFIANNSLLQVRTYKVHAQARNFLLFTECMFLVLRTGRKILSTKETSQCRASKKQLVYDSYNYKKVDKQGFKHNDTDS